MTEHPASTFDDQALRYDGRVGLPPTVGSLVARSIVQHASAGPGDLVVELGVGTGEIGVHLSRLPVRYVGLDSSPAMLDVFRAKGVRGSSSLIVADCNQPWPLPDGSAATVFASRVIHLLDPEHIAGETVRVCRPAGSLILGRVVRERGSIKERLRRQRQRLLVEAGITPRQGEEGTRRVVERCLAAGGRSLGRSEVAEWTGETTPAQVIAGWETLSRMGSVSVDPATRAGILDDLRRWGRAEFGDLDRPEAFRERYAIDVVRLP
ncbi:MAG TPA: class I SAM-dependent methyltransferase [Thermomicrobiales bacterium]|nr:class I SAM-dependent methyltransferase [Thermomicrobiales bacterium]